MTAAVFAVAMLFVPVFVALTVVVALTVAAMAIVVALFLAVVFGKVGNIEPLELAVKRVVGKIRVEVEISAEFLDGVSDFHKLVIV